MNTFTVRAYPGRTIAYPPLIFGKTFRAYLESTRTTPAERFVFLAAMTDVLSFSEPGYLPGCFFHVATDLPFPVTNH